jgi:hypothetical protein
MPMISIRGTPLGVFCKKNYYIWSFLEVPTDNGYLKPLLDPAVSILKLKPPHGGFRSETAVT